MSKGPKYLIDTSVFIDAKNNYYAFAFCPGFWQCVLREHKRKRVYSIDFVRQEMLVGRDELADWATNDVPPTFFCSTDDVEVMAQYQDIMAWVNANPQFDPNGRADFASGADGWLVAYAKVYGTVIITREQYNRESRKRVPIPNVCRQFDVAYTDVFHMLRDLRVTLTCRGRK